MKEILKIIRKTELKTRKIYTISMLVMGCSFVYFMAYELLELLSTLLYVFIVTFVISLITAFMCMVKLNTLDDLKTKVYELEEKDESLSLIKTEKQGNSTALGGDVKK